MAQVQVKLPDDKNEWVEGKFILKSLTFWFSALILFLPEIVDFLQELLNQNLITEPNQVAWVLRVIGIISIILRFKSKQPVTLERN